MMAKKNKKMELVLVLDNIRSNFNVGSLFRIADCAGVSKIFLGGITPAPKDRFGRDNKELKKVALGADENVEWESSPCVLGLLKRLKKEGFEIVSLEQDKNSVDYKKFIIKRPTVLVLGNEVEGVDKKVLNLSDKIVEIKMKGKKESLNVAVAAGVAIFRILNI